MIEINAHAIEAISIISNFLPKDVELVMQGKVFVIKHKNTHLKIDDISFTGKIEVLNNKINIRVKNVYIESGNIKILLDVF